MNVDEAITGISVSYNYKDLIQRAYMSIRKFHPNMQIIIIDGSDEDSPCYEYIKDIADEKTRVIHASENIGHGRGLDYGISQATTPFVLTFDSDIEMTKTPLQAMINMFDEDTYGVGYIEKTDLYGYDFGAIPAHMSKGWMKYLHPYFGLIQVKEYKKYKPFIHHGAPAVNTMLDIYRKHLSDKVIKEFPGLGHSSGTGFSWVSAKREYVQHDVSGFGSTGRRRIKEGKDHIEGSWEKPIDPGGITCITCTGDRPLPFSLCKKWMFNQTIHPDQWIIVDDGHIQENKLDFPFVDYIYRKPKSDDPKHTMILNMQEAIDRISNEKIIIIEDDEYYAPTYIEEMSNRFGEYELIGIGRSKYYYLPTFGYFRHSNMGHASFAQTGFKKSFLPEIKSVLQGDSYLDVRLWEIVNGKNAPHTSIDSSLLTRISDDKRGLVFEDKESLFVGMKGMPGRKGIGVGHHDASWYVKDINSAVLKKWIPKEEDMDIYLTLLNKN